VGEQDRAKSPVIDGVPLEAMLFMHYIDALAEAPDELSNSNIAAERAY
jgi:hypothetical protein